MVEPYLILTKRLGLRRWTEADFAPFCAMNQNPAVMAFYPKPLSSEETTLLLAQIETHFREYGYGPYAVDVLETRTFIGYTGFMHPTFDCWFTPCVEIGWRLDTSVWNRGYATEGAQACLDYGFAQLGFDAVYSFTSALNHASERVMQKLGMSQIGEFEHPNLPKGDKLSRHVLYRMNATELI